MGTVDSPDAGKTMNPPASGFSGQPERLRLRAVPGTAGHKNGWGWLSPKPFLFSIISLACCMMSNP